MSETNVPYGTGTGTQQQWASGPPDSGSTSGTTHSGGDTGGGMKEKVGEAASQVGDAGRETARDVREKARDVAHEAGDQARGLADKARSELRSQMGAQQQHLAGGLRSLGNELGQMANGSQDPGYATDLVNRAGDVSGKVAQWFEDREPADVLHEVESFARRRPGTFLLVAAGAGLLVGRFLRGAKEVSKEGSGPGSTTGSTTGSTAGTTSGSASVTPGNPAQYGGTAQDDAAARPASYAPGGDTYVGRP